MDSSPIRIRDCHSLTMVSVCVVGAVAGWHVIGDAFISSLQVGDDEYEAILELAPWAGAFFGLVAALLLVSTIWVFAALVVHLVRRR